MTTRPSRTNELDLGDLIVLYKGNDSDYRTISVPDFMDKVKDEISDTEFSSYYLRLDKDETLDLSDNKLSMWIKVLESSPSKALTVVLPSANWAKDGQEVLLNNLSSNPVSVFFGSAGASVIGGEVNVLPSLEARFKYDKTLKQWFRTKFAIGSVTTVVGKEGDVTAEDVSASLLTDTDLMSSFNLKTPSGLNQQSINDVVGAPWYVKTGGYAVGGSAKLSDGVIVVSTTAANTNNPNSNMIGWEIATKDKGVLTWSGRTQEQKNKDVVHIQDFSTISEFDAALSSGAMGVLDNIDRSQNKTRHGSFSRTTNIVARDSGRLKISQGTPENPATQAPENPPLWVQRVVSHDSYSASAHIVGGGLVEVMAKGSRSDAAANKGTWMGFFGNAVANSVNVGTSAAPKGDIDGNVIGVAGFAASDFLYGNGRITTALWGYAASPVLTDTEYTNATDTWQTVGLEVNVAQRHKDAGYVNYLGGTKGSAAGIYLVNYQEPNEPRKSWQFGIVLHGQQIAGDNINTDPSTWSGYHVGIQLDKIKDVGIRFQDNADRQKTIGIQFPTSVRGGALGYKTAISLGDNKINMGQFSGATVEPYDMWCTGDQLMMRSADNSTNRRILMGDFYTATATFAQTHTINVKWANGTTFKIPAQLVV